MVNVADQHGTPDMPDYIMTRSGKRYSHARPSLQSIDIEDIATSLSNQCRFLGHTDRFFSTAQHSVEVAALCLTLTYERLLPTSNEAHATRVSREAALAGLLHDAHEAYVGDFPTPFKALLGLGFREPEALSLAVVEEALGLTALMAKHAAVVHEADRLMLWSDAIRWGMDRERAWVPADAVAYFPDAKGWTPKKARRRFMAQYKLLGGPVYAQASNLLRAA